jgi:hypothetical protein
MASCSTRPRASALDARRREALLRYVLRLTIAQDRIEQGQDGLVRILLKRPSSTDRRGGDGSAVAALPRRGRLSGSATTHHLTRQARDRLSRPRGTSVFRTQRAPLTCARSAPRRSRERRPRRREDRLKGDHRCDAAAALGHDASAAAVLGRYVLSRRPAVGDLRPDAIGPRPAC